MFDELVESNVVAKKTNKSWTVLISTLIQSVVIFILVLIPLIYTEALPKAMMATLLVAPPPPPPPPPPPQAVEVVKVVRPVARLLTQGRLLQPRAIPKNVVVFKEAELPPEPPPGAGVFGGVDSLLGGLGEGATGAAPPPPPPPRVTRTKVGGNVQEAKIIARPNPVYPPLARQARIQGKVQLHAIIDKDGRVGELQVVSGHPLLVKAALDAVQNWRYQPTILNGEPVEVDTTIDVNFVLGG
jgi:protein TonB